MNQEKKIKSYGIILFTRQGNKIKFCIYNRRDTYAYYDYLVGFYDPRTYPLGTQEDTCVSDRLALLASLMTPEEKDRIRSYSFDQLWDDLFVNKYIYPYIERKEEAREKFEASKEKVLKIKSASSIKSTEWGFPKGKQDKNELPKDCAFREFEEETGFTRHECELWDIGPICETFVSYDWRTYETYYYIAETKKEFPTRYIMTPKSIRKLTVSAESYDLKWVTLEESEDYLNPRHQLVLKKVLSLITSNE